MKALKNILFGVAGLIALFIVVGLFLPSTWEVKKSVTMAASKERIYKSVANFHQWLEWSPWNDSQDASLKYTYEGPEEGVGAQQNWTSDNMGTGFMKLLEADPEKGIKYELFIDMKNFKSTLHGEMTFESVDGQTNVTWTDRGDSGSNIIKKWMSLSMGSMLGKEMEQGLLKIKEIVEKEPAAQANDAEPAQAEGALAEEAAAPAENLEAQAE